MNIYKDQCYICLDDKVYFKKSSVCVNDDCWTFMCKKCFVELTNSEIETCPICREDFVEESYYLDYMYFMSKAKEIMINVVLYFMFYSIGFSTVCILLFTKYKKKIIFDSIIDCNSSYLLISLFVFPLTGFVLWYCIVLLFVFVYSLVKPSVNHVEGESYNFDDL